MKENKILISILVPTYNRVEYLKECLDSIVEQKWFDLRELELIVSDNSEWDETRNFMEKYKKENKDWNIFYNKNKKNLWMVWNWNKLLELKKWEYFIFLSDDDKFYDKNSLNNLYNEIYNTRTYLCCWKRVFIDKKWETVNDINDFSQAYINSTIKYTFDLKNNLLWFGGILFKKTNIRFEKDVWTAADRCFNLFYLKNFWSCAFLNKNCFCYRFHDSQLSNRLNVLNLIKNELSIWNKLWIKSYQKFFLFARFILAVLYWKILWKFWWKLSLFVKEKLWK